MDDIWFLKQIDWLGGLSDEHWRRLAEQAVRRDVEAEGTVFEPSRDPHSVFVLESGRVRIFRLSSEGEEATLGYILPGEVFGELAGFGDYPRESFAVAQAAARVWKLPVALFRTLVQERPTLTLEITQQMGVRMKRVESRVESLVFRNVRSRLALALVELVEDLGGVSGERGTLEGAPSQSELATLVGASRQSVNAALGRLRDEGAVELEGGRITRVRIDRLREVAEELAPH